MLGGVLEKSPRLSGHSCCKGAEVTGRQKLLIRCFELIIHQLPQAGALLWFAKSGTKYQNQNTLIAFWGSGQKGTRTYNSTNLVLSLLKQVTKLPVLHAWEEFLTYSKMSVC